MSAAPSTAMIKIAPVKTLERINDPRWNRSDRTLYESGSLMFLPRIKDSGEGVPLIVDHDFDQRVGTVHELFRMEWVDGPWICASATVDDLPRWLRRSDTKASFGYRTLARGTFTECELVTKAIVDEVSVLLRLTPREPLAEVLSVRPIEPHRVSDEESRATEARIVAEQRKLSRRGESLDDVYRAWLASKQATGTEIIHHRSGTPLVRRYYETTITVR